MIKQLFTAAPPEPSLVARPNKNEATWRFLSYALILLVGVIMLATFRDYGITFDEETQRVYGDRVLAWYGSLFQDRRALDNTFIYGGFFDAIAQLAARVLPFDVYESRHLINCLFGLLSISIACKLGSHLAGPMAGFICALFLTLTPVLYGHSFNNPKDIPFSALCLLSLYFMITSYGFLPRLPLKAVIKIGVAMGLAMGVRVGGLLLFGYLVTLMLAWLLIAFRLKSPAVQSELRKTLLALASSFVLVLTISWLVMLLCWPWAQVKPLVSPFRAFVRFTGYETGIKSFFNGVYLLPDELPWHYLPTWFSITLPEFYFISLLAGGTLAVVFLIGFRGTRANFERLVKVVLLIQAALVPLAIAILLRSPLYDAHRHFLFTIPPLTILAGISFAALLRANTSRLVKVAISLLIAVSISLTAIDMVQLHPYQYVFFNRLIAGGVKAASERFETDYWGSSYKEGAEWVINNYRPDTEEKIRVSSCSNLSLVPHYFVRSEEVSARFHTVDTGNDPHVFLANTRNRCHKKKAAKNKVLHIVERQGVPLLYVIEYRSPQKLADGNRTRDR
jgi:hypothetical protein